MGRSAAAGTPAPAPPVSRGDPKVDWVHFIDWLKAGETSSSYDELRRGSLPPEELCSTAKNAGEMHGKHAVGADLPTQRSPNNASETADYSQLQSSLV